MLPEMARTCGWSRAERRRARDVLVPVDGLQAKLERGAQEVHVILANLKDKGRRRIACSPQQQTWSRRRRLPVEDVLVLSSSFDAREYVQPVREATERIKDRRRGRWEVVARRNRSRHGGGRGGVWREIGQPVGTISTGKERATEEGVEGVKKDSSGH